MRHFIPSFLILGIGFALAWLWGGATALALTGVLAIMEISLSFDNAVVNATVLRTMSARWQRRFMTWGMVIAVFGVRFLLPILIVAAVTGQAVSAVAQMALHDPEQYAKHVTSAHGEISAFGGMYLLLVFLSFFVEENKSLHWLGWIERQLSRMGSLESIEVAMALCALLTVIHFIPVAERLDVLIAGVVGVVLFVLVKSFSSIFENAGEGAARAGLAAFLYLEMLDLSFSLDGVIGAFAITRDVVVILLGLTIGAMFVRSLTLFMVAHGTLEEYRYLEHGAHYAIGALAVLMLVDLAVHVPEYVTGLTGFILIVLSLWSSIRARRRAALHG